MHIDITKLMPNQGNLVNIWSTFHYRYNQHLSIKNDLDKLKLSVEPKSAHINY